MTDYLVTSKIRLFFQYFFIGLVFLITLIWLITSHKKDLRWIIQRVNITLQKNPYLIMIMLFSCAIPVVASAWLFSSASAQNPQDSNSFSDKNTQNVDLLTSQISMAGDQKPDDGIIIAMDDTALVPEIGPAGTLADVYDIPASDAIIVYNVTPGDTVAMVAKRFGVSESTIRWANNLSKTDVLHVGQILTILPITGVKHTVTKGETLATVATRYKADVQDIADYNGLDADQGLIVGQVIIVPDGQIAIPAKTTSSKVIKNNANIPSTKTTVSAPKGYYIRPITLTGNPRIRKTQGFHDRYNAIDIGAPIGTPILAMASGTVILAKGPACPNATPTYWNGGYGNLTIIQHANGTQTLYAHQTCLNVTVGQKVSQGEVIGKVGSTGRSTGPHLHFEIRGIRPTPVLY